MSETRTRRRRRHSERGVSLHVAGGDLREFAALAAFPVILVFAHYLSGANNVLGALSLTVVIAIALAVAALTSATSAEALSPRPLLPVALPYFLVLLAAAWTLVGTTSRPNALLVGLADPRPLSIDRSGTVLEIVKLAGLGCAFLVGWVQGAGRRRAVATAHLLVATAALYTLVGFGDYLSGEQARAGSRLTAGLLSANSTATLLGMSLVIATALVIRQGVRTKGETDAKPDTGKPLRVFSLMAAMAVLGLGLLLTQSRMGFLATGLGLAFLLARSAAALRHRVAFGSMARSIIGLMVVAGLFLGGSILLGRLIKVDADAANRGAIFESHWRAFLASPDFGYGLGSFTTVNNLLMAPDTFGALRSIRAAHNVYIQWLEEAGVIGATPMFACIAVIVGVTLVGGKGVEARDRTALYGLIGADIVVMLHGTTDYALQVPSIAAAWAFMLGLQLNLSRANSSAKRPAA